MKFIYKCIKKTTRQVAVQALSKEIWFIFLPLVLLLTSSFFFCFPISFLVLLYILECPYTLTPFQLVFPFFIFLSFFLLKLSMKVTSLSSVFFFSHSCFLTHGELFDPSIPALLPLTGITQSTCPAVWRLTEKKKSFLHRHLFYCKKNYRAREFTKTEDDKTHLG